MMRFRTVRTRPALLLAAAIIAGVGAGAAGVSVAQASDRPVNRSQMTPPSYSKNADGLTYGSAAHATTPENEPDLIAVRATNGKTGYVYRTHLEPQSAANPAQAVQMMKAQKSNAQTSHATAEIPVYLADGKTQIGWFAFSD